MKKMAFNCETTNCESNLTTRWWIPKAVSLHKSLMTTLYSATLLVARPKKRHHDPTNSFVGENMT